MHFLFLGHLYHRDSGQGSSLLPHIHRITQGSPEIHAALQGDERWDYDIMKLEKVTNKRYVLT